jgi:hypothetical protein
MDRLGRSIALSALALLTIGAGSRAHALQDPPARPAPALLEGVEMESALVYDADPKTPHLLRASFAGKSHARWWIGAGAEGAEARLVRLRSEQQLFALRLDAPGSVELAGAQRDEALAQLELRRALLQFESFEWKSGEERTRTVALGPLGSLRARFEGAQDARPREIAFLDPQGHVQDSCRAIRWSSAKPRPLPESLELWHAETRIWKETVRRIQPMTFARDAFLPRDRAAEPAATGKWNVIQTPSPEYAARRFELPAGATWESSRKELERLRAEWSPKLGALGLELENRGTLELDGELRPRYVVLRLAKLPEQLPEGFERAVGRTAVGTPLDGFERVTGPALSALREKLPAGAKPGAPYVRWALEPGDPKQVLLLLAWVPVR